MSACLLNKTRYIVTEHVTKNRKTAWRSERFATPLIITGPLFRSLERIFKACFVSKDPGAFGLPGPSTIGIETILRQNTDTHVVVIRDSQHDNRLVAFSCLQFTAPGKIHIHSLCTSRKVLRQGCCKRLMEHITSQYGDYELSLRVRVSNYMGEGSGSNPACFCYEEYGFRVKNSPCTIETDGMNCDMIRPPTPYTPPRSSCPP